MRINSLYLENFGHFDQQRWDFDDGFNLFFAENEYGKSTLLDGLLMTFYGTETRKRDLRENLRARYLDPVKSGRGLVSFEYAGKAYRLERRFGASIARDVLTLCDEMTGKVISLPSKQQPGQLIFGMSEAAFRRSLFVGASTTVICAEAKSDELIERLLNRDTQDEEASCRIVLDRLDRAKRELLSANGKQGRIAVLRSEMDQLTLELEDAIAHERAQEMSQRRMEQLQAETAVLSEELEQLKAQRIQLAHLQASIDEAGYQAELLNERFDLLTDDGRNTPPMNEAVIDAEISALQCEQVALEQQRTKVMAENAEAVNAAKRIAQAISRAEGDRTDIRETVFSNSSVAPRNGRRKFRRLLYLIIAAGLTAAGVILGISLMASGQIGLSASTGAVIAVALVGVAAATALILQFRMYRDKKPDLKHTVSDAAYRVPVGNLFEDRQRCQADIQRSDGEIDRCNMRLEGVAVKLRQLERLRGRVVEYRQRCERMDRQLRQTADDGEAQHDAENAATYPERLERMIREKQAQCDMRHNELVQLHYDCSEGNRGKRSVSQILELQSAAERELEERLARLKALEAAHDGVSVAYARLASYFGPQLSSRTEALLQAMTGLSRRIRIDEHLAVSVENEADHSLLPWEKLSSGMLDQVYLALRLALIEQLEPGERLPIFMDDALVYFDDARARRTYRFLKRYAKAQGTQLLFFTCHGRFARWDRSIDETEST